MPNGKQSIRPEATASITKLFSGWISDRLGKRKFLMISGYALAAFTKPVASATLGSMLEERGIAVIDTVMQQDPNAIKPGAVLVYVRSRMHEEH